MKNSTLLSLIFILFLQHIISGQENFEGILKFKIKIQDKTGQMTDEQSDMFLGDTQTYYLKGKKYRSEMNGMLKMTTIHEGRDTLFTKMKDVNSLMYTLTNESEEKVISYELKKTDKVILGYKCDLLEVKTNKGFHQYYFNKDLKCAPTTYENHKMGLWDFFTKKTGGTLPIISISDVEDYKSYIELTSVERKELNNNMFIKPELPIVKMPE